MTKRDWVYILPPKAFEMTCLKCGGVNIEWSEYEKHIWCYDCANDNVGNLGVFSGPIPIHTVSIFGLHFDRLNLKTDKVELLNFKDSSYIQYEELLKEFGISKLAKDVLEGGSILDKLKEEYGENILQRLYRYERILNDAKI